jgi:hypothetical protein
MIGSLLYLTASRPDIMFSVCICARFQANPKKSHLSVVKRILRYLKHTLSVRLWYPKGATFELIGYSILDYTSCKIDRNSTSRGCHLLGRSLVSWTPKKKNSVSVALSTAEAKYIIVVACCTQIIYMPTMTVQCPVSTEQPLFTVRFAHNLFLKKTSLA